MLDILKEETFKNNGNSSLYFSFEKDEEDSKGSGSMNTYVRNKYEKYDLINKKGILTIIPEDKENEMYLHESYLNNIEPKTKDLVYTNKRFYRIYDVEKVENAYILKIDKLKAYENIRNV
jgi:hypothetical protein